MLNKKLIVFASGTNTGGGSGFANLAKMFRDEFGYEGIIAVVSNHKNGGVQKHAKKFNIPFVYFPPPYTTERYQEIVSGCGAEFIALSGWLKHVSGLDPRKTFNIHPGPLPQFGGKKMYGHYVHDAVIKAYANGEITHSAVSMHFVTEEYDKGPLFLSIPIEIKPDDTADTLAKRVNEQEHYWQPIATHLIINGHISWDGVNTDSLVSALPF